MKILICGSFCSGKTTLASMLHQQLSGSLVVFEPIRELAAVFSMEELTHSETRDYLFLRQLFEERKAAHESPLVICDAGIESNIAHNRLFGYPPKGQADLRKFGHSRYDQVFYCGYEDIDLLDDGFRLLDKQEQQRLAVLIRETLVELDYAYITLNGTPKERLRKVLDKLKIEPDGKNG